MSADDARPLLRQFCDDLRLLRSQAGGPSLRALAARVRLSKSQVATILNGRIGRLPDWDVVRDVVDGCHQYAQSHGRLDQLSLATGIEQFWRPRYAMVEYAFGQAARPGRAAARPAAIAAVPRQLPTAVRHFAGRAGPLAVLGGLLDDAPTAVVISAIGGTAGVGKTTLAVHWAHRVADRFPDGHLYVNLRGFGPTSPVLDPGAAIRRFLDALGVPAQRIPSDLDAQTALYRSELSGRRMLILLDNACDSAQVRPLLPGSAGCLVLVTSRDPLAGLVAAEHAHPVTLDLLTRDEAADMLSRRLGRARVTADPGAVEEIIDRCARLPLALSIVAARAATGSTPLAELAGQLRDPGRRLDLLNVGDPTTDVQAVFAWSYPALTEPAARVFRLLGRHPGPDIGAAAVASLAARPPTEVRPMLAELIRANLVTESKPGRYACHDLLRAYAAALGDAVDAEPDRRAATTRVLDHYLHTASAADRLLYPSRDGVVLAPPATGAVPDHLSDRDGAIGWLSVEHPVLLAAVDHAVATGHDGHAWQLAWTLTGFLERHQRWPDLIAVARAALTAAQRLDDPAASALAHRILSRALIETGRYPEAQANLGLALDLATRAGDPAAQAHTEHHLAYVCERQGRWADALDHDRRALTLYRAAGHRPGQAHALNGIGWYQTLLGDHVGALASCEQALAVLRDLDYRSGEAATLDTLGRAHSHLGHHAQAVGSLRRAIALYRELGQRFDEAEALTHLGESYELAGRSGSARAVWRQALAILTELGHRDAETLRGRLTSGPA